MLVKELIALLHTHDPSGMLNVTIGNHDILFAERVPANHDGYQQTLVSHDGLHVRKVILNGVGEKIRLITCTLEEVLADNPDVEIEVTGHVDDGMKKHVQRARTHARLSCACDHAVAYGCPHPARCVHARLNGCNVYTQ